MSFAPSKGMKKGNKEMQQYNDYERDQEQNIDGQSQMSEGDQALAQKLANLEDAVSKLTLQQDMYRGLLDLQNEVDRVKKVDKNCRKIARELGETSDALNVLNTNYESFSGSTDRNIQDLSKGLDDESSTRVLENKKIKKVMIEIEKRQKQIDYDTKLGVQNVEAIARKEILEVGEEMDRKIDGNTEMLDNKITETHQSLKRTILEDEDAFAALTERVNTIEGKFGGQIDHLNKGVFPQVDKITKRRKVDMEDLKDWLVDSVDLQLKEKMATIETTLNEKYKSTILKQKNQITELKSQVKSLKEDKVQETFSKRKPSEDFLEQEEKREGVHPTIVARARFQEGTKEFDFDTAVQALRPNLDSFEESLIMSSKEIQDKIDDLKLRINQHTAIIHQNINQIGDLKK